MKGMTDCVPNPMSPERSLGEVGTGKKPNLECALELLPDFVRVVGEFGGSL